MASKSFRYLIDFSLAVLSSLLLVISFPRFDLGFLAWIGLLPLLIAINGKSLKYSFLISFICGILFFGGVFHWILAVPKYTLLHHALLAVYLGSYFGLFGFLFNFISKRLGIILAVFSAPFIWVSLEYIRGNLSFLSLPWPFLAHSQYQYPVVIQIASIVGTYGVSFLIVLVNAALAIIVFYFTPTLACAQASAGRLALPPAFAGTLRAGRRQGGGERRGLKGGWEGLKERKYLLIVTASLLLSTLLYGYFTITNTITGNKVKISLVQGNIEQKKKWDLKFAREIMQIYTHLTEEASKDQPALIIWPETATPGSINQDIRLHIEVRNIAKKAETYLLLGSAQHQKFAEKEKKKFKYLNSAFLINPQPKLGKNQRYDKIRLFPFGEYLPFKEIIPWSLINVVSMDNYMPGEQFTVFEHPDFRFGMVICWESIFPNLVRQFVKRGAQVMINITNEGWFGDTAPYQFLATNVFRAVENRIYVVRCANIGISCLIDPYGRIVDRVKDKSGRDIHVRGVLTGTVVPLDSNTFYTRHGEWLFWLMFPISVFFVMGAFLRKTVRLNSR